MFHGSQWIELETDECQRDPDPEVPTECVSGLRATDRVTHGVLLTTSVLLNTVIPITRYNSLQNLLRVTAYVLLLDTAYVLLLDMVKEAELWWVRVAHAYVLLLDMVKKAEL